MDGFSCVGLTVRLFFIGFRITLMLEIKDGAITVGGKQLFHDLSFCTADGGLTAITGPHGCGKTSLIRAFLGFQPLTSGYVSVDCEAILPLTAALFRVNMLYVPQDLRLCVGSFSELFESLTDLRVNTDLTYARKNCSMSGSVWRSM